MSKEQQLVPSIDLLSLAMRARDAYDQKRTKECLTITKSLLMADPENAEAKALQAAIRSDIQRNLDDARALLADSRRHDNLQEHRKAAQILLLKILYLDPEHEEAKTLLSSARGSAQPVSVPVPAAPRPKPDVAEPPETAFAVEYRRIEKNKEQGTRIKVPAVLLGLVVVAGLLIIAGQTQFPKQPEPPAPSFAPRGEIDVQQAPSEKPSTTVIAAAPAPVAPIELGTLAVSSPTAAEIYMGDKYLGSTPITLELPAGNHTLEYRHGDLRQLITHVVKPRETTTAMVTFDVTLQIN